MNTKLTRRTALWAAFAVLALAAAALHSAGPGAAPVASAAVARGQDVFETTCFACHGLDGKGALPGVPDLTGPDGRLTKSDADLFASIRDGVQSPGNALAMPARGGNPALTDEDLLAVLGYMRSSFAPETLGAAGPVAITIHTPAAPAPATATVPTAAMARLPADQPTVNIGRGAKLWANTCSRCHNLRNPREFSDLDWHAIAAHMRLRAGLPATDANDILAFLKASN